ncbi:MAG TPA: HAD family hydrolase [Leptolyngbyaceae cyanobacterium M33_DOE_097]|uniref:HAD family hydrolase n=1 Tax=Oscillatoriales cyanobacterium SpSt-418 TaxID=2282169 RepID=A0A7C3PFT5_9CYAN|nr:HAD family hydrolase [Leptolyngbyaceae cyanobacterium M33_DOE_097]
MAQLQALIFDVDGTLADTERDGHRVAFNQAFAEAGLDWEWTVDGYRSLLEVAGGKERIRFYRERYTPDWYPTEDLFTWSAALHQAKTRYYRELLVQGKIPLRPGVRRLIQEARAAGLRLAIATTSAIENVIPLLEVTLGPESPQWFEVIAAGDMVPAKKPAPDVYLHVLEAMKLLPQTCLAIEDSYQGLQAALQANLTTVVTVNPYTQQHDFSQASLVVDCLGEPDKPFQVLMGGTYQATWFDLEVANALLEVAAKGA